MNQYPAYSVRQQIERLPAVAQRRYARLRAELEDSEALVRSCMARERDAENRVADLERRYGYNRDADLLPELERAREDFAQLGRERMERNLHRGNLDQVVQRCNNFISAIMTGHASHRGAAAAVDARPRKGESYADAISRIRAEIARLQGELRAVREAPLPREELLKMARTTVNDLALAGAPAVITGGGKFTVQWDAYSVSGYPAASDNYAPRLFAALFPDRMYELLVQQIADVPGVSAAERAEREIELEERILQLEHWEESLIQRTGGEVLRRPDASPHALLGLTRFPEGIAQAAE